MKFVISFFLCLSAYASSPIHVLYEEDRDEAQMYKDILIQDYQIPEELIIVKMIKDCEIAKSEGKLDMCLKNNGDLFMVSVDRNFINESLKVFRAP